MKPATLPPPKNIIVATIARTPMHVHVQCKNYSIDQDFENTISITVHNPNVKLISYCAELIRVLI